MGRSIPMLEGEPELFPSLNSTWSAFIQLDRSRQFGYGHPQPIQFTEIEAFGRARKITGERFSDMLDHVQLLDQIYLEHHAEVARKEQQKQKAKLKK